MIRRRALLRRGGGIALGILIAAVALLSSGLGYWMRPEPNLPVTAAAGKTVDKKSSWTCSMHPQVRLPNAGSCPICSMPLIPADSAGASETGKVQSLQLGEAALAMAAVETAPVLRRRLSREMRTTGKVQYNETTLATVTTRIDGYIERLFVDYTGVPVEKGDHLVEIYSPGLVVAQNELLLGGRDRPDDRLVQAGRDRLLRWGITPGQIAELLRTRKVSERMTIYSPVKGTVVEKLVVEKSSVKAGDVLYRLVNLDSVWVSLDLYEYELGWIRQGQRVEIASEAHPGVSLGGLVTFISPIVDEESRTVKVRVNVSNANRDLKPGMFVSAVVKVDLLADGQPASSGLEGQYACPMHPEVLQPKAGSCPLCGMPLQQIPPRKEAGGIRASPLVLAVPRSAVLDSGTRKVVYVERSKGRFESVDIRTGPRAGEFFPVLAGLSEGDRVAIQGNFLLDSQFQIQGLNSLFAMPEATAGRLGP